VNHVPAMQKSARGQGVVPGERRKSTGGTFMIDQLEELLGKLLCLRRNRCRSIRGRQSAILRRYPGGGIRVDYAVRDVYWWGTCTGRCLARNPSR
jgi:hypothetical protein